MAGLLGNVDQSQIQQLLSALQGGGFGQLYNGIQGGQGQAAPASATGLVPFGFSQPMVPPSQAQPYQWMTGQAQGLDPMALFNQSLTQAQNAYNQLGTTTPGTTPGTTPPGTTPPGTTPPGATSPINFGNLPPNALGWVPGADQAQMQKFYDAMKNNGILGLLTSLRGFKKTPQYEGESTYGYGFE